MITKFSITNFKAFKQKTTIELKPLTILCGANSVGKSSLLKGLLLLKQTLEANDSANAVSLEGPYQFARRLEDLLHLGDGTERSTLEYEFEISRQVAKKQKAIGRLSFSIQVHQGKLSSSDNYLKTFSIKDVAGNHLSIEKKSFGYTVSSDLKLIDHYRNRNNNKQPPTLNVDITNFLPDYLYSSKDDYSGVRLPMRFLDYEFQGKDPLQLGFALSVFKQDLRSISYLGPLRASPQIAYLQLSKSNPSLDDSGANSAQVFWRRKSEKVIFDRTYQPLRKALRAAFTMLGMKHSITPRRSDIVYSLDVAIDKKVKVPISEVGFGLSQSLPVLLKGLLAPVGSLLILEQPEIHLHPLWKANLADLLLVWAQDGKQLLVETHSTELIDKLRLLVIRKPEIKNLINIIFVEQPDLDKTGTILRTIELDDLGVPSEWPKGFCDQTTNLMEEIVLARAAARRKGEMVK